LSFRAKGWSGFFFLFLFLNFICLFERERAQAGCGAEGGGEADSPLSREPDAGLYPRSHPGAPHSEIVDNWSFLLSSSDFWIFEIRLGDSFVS